MKFTTFFLTLLFTVHAIAGSIPPQPVTITGPISVTGNVNVISSVLPTGAATELTLQSILTNVDNVESELTTLLGYTDQLEGYVDGIEGLLTSGNASLSSIDSRLSTANTTLTSILGFVDQLEGYTDGIEGLLTTGNTNTSSIDTKLSTTNSTLTTIDGHVDGLEALVGTTNSTLTTIDGHVDQIEGYVDGLEALGTAGNVSTASIDTKLTTTNSTLSTISTSTDQLEGYVDGLEGLATTGNTNTGSIDTKLTTTNSQLTSINANTDTLETLVTSTNTKLDTLHTDVDQLEGYVDGIEGLIGTTNTNTANTATNVTTVNTTLNDKHASGSLAAGDTTTAVNLPLYYNGSTAVQVNGTWAGNLNVECTSKTSPVASDYIAQTVFNTNGSTGVASVVSSGIYRLQSSGFTFCQVRRTTAGTGTAVVELNGSAGPSIVIATSPSVNNFSTATQLTTGSAIVGKVGIDQTTPGTTNGVQVNAALPAGTNLLGKVGIDQTTPGTTNAVVASTKTALTGNAPAAVTCGVASGVAVATNASRKGLILTNTSTNNISLHVANGTAVLNSGITLYPGGSWIMDEYSFTTAAINCIASGASSNLGIQEFQ